MNLSPEHSSAGGRLLLLGYLEASTDKLEQISKSDSSLSLPPFHTYRHRHILSSFIHSINLFNHLYHTSLLLARRRQGSREPLRLFYLANSSWLHLDRLVPGSKEHTHPCRKVSRALRCPTSPPSRSRFQSHLILALFLKLQLRSLAPSERLGVL